MNLQVVCPNKNNILTNGYKNFLLVITVICCCLATSVECTDCKSFWIILSAKLPKSKCICEKKHNKMNCKGRWVLLLALFWGGTH